MNNAQLKQFLGLLDEIQLAGSLGVGPRQFRAAAVKLAREVSSEFAPEAWATLGEPLPVKASKRVDELKSLWLHELGVAALSVWVKENRSEQFDHMGLKEIWKKLAEYVLGLKEKGRELLESGLRFAVDSADPNPRAKIDKTIGTTLFRKESSMAFKFDPNGIPKDPTAFETAVRLGLMSFGIDDMKIPKDVGPTAAVFGMLILDGHNDERAGGFSSAILDSFLELSRTVKFATGPKLSRVLYENLAAVVTKVGGLNDITYQLFAFVGRALIANADNQPLEGPLAESSIRAAIDDFAISSPTSLSLDLKLPGGADGGDVEIVRENVEAVAVCAAGARLEELRLLDTLDIILERYANGLLPITGSDDGGKALDDYEFTDPQRLLNKAQRMSLFSRVVGTAGGDVPADVQPNLAYNDLLLRFAASLSELERQERVADLLSSNRPRVAAVTMEQVRKAGRDWFANASLYAWGRTPTDARKVRDMIVRAFNILGKSSILAAFGVKTAYQVVERVWATMPGGVPNIVKYNTMAESEKELLRVSARYVPAWNGSTKQLFQTIFDRQDPQFDIPFGDYQLLLRHAANWLAVQGIKDAQVDQYSQPEQTAYAPSIPSYSGDIAGAHADGNGTVNRLRELVASGQAPSLDQLRTLLPN